VPRPPPAVPSPQPSSHQPTAIGWAPLGGSQENEDPNARITAFLYSIDSADDPPLPPVQDILQASNLSAQGFDQKSDSDVSTASKTISSNQKQDLEKHDSLDRLEKQPSTPNITAPTPRADSLFEKSVFRPKDWSASSLAVMCNSTSNRSSFSENYGSRPWVLLLAYVRIKRFVNAWRALRAETHPKSTDPVTMVLEQLDSRDWVHVCDIVWHDDNSLSFQDHSNTTRAKSPLLLPGGGFKKTAFLHLSTSHAYLRRGSKSGVDESLLIRLTDIHRIEPSNGMLVITYYSEKKKNDEREGPSSRSSEVGSVASLKPKNSKKMSKEDRRSDDEEITTPLLVSKDGGTRLTVRISGDDNSLMALQILDLQARMLRHLSSGLSMTIRQKKFTKSLTIVHFNDVYHLPPFKPADARGIVGGVSRFHSVLARIRETSNPLVLFSGDFMGPSLMSVITKGKQMVDAFNFLGVNYGVFGNHEFDFGLKTLKEVIHGYTQGRHVYSGSQTVWLMSNMIEPDGSPLGGAQPYAVCTWNNVKIGLLGLCENWLPQCSNLLSTEAIYLDIFDRGEELARMLKNDYDCEVIIALTHNRYPVDRELSERCPSIDYILGGHDHKAKNDPKHRITKSGQEFEYLTLMECSISPEEPHPKFKLDLIPITFEVPESDFMKGLIERYEIKMAEKLGRAIGKTDEELDSTEETVRFKEGVLTNFILDVIQDGMETELAFLGAAAIAGKEVKPPGNVTLGDVFAWFPNETKVMTMRLQGKTILQTLKVMVREVPAEAPSFPHSSAQLSFTINVFRKPPIIENVKINGEPLDMERWYLCAVEDFVGMGKAKYKHVAAEGEVVVGEDDAVQVATLVRDFFVRKKAFGRQTKEDATQTSLVNIVNVTKVVSSATHIGVDTDTAKSQRFIRAMICELLGCDRSSIFIVDQQQQQLHFIPEGGTEIRFPMSVGLAGFVASEQKSINIADVYDDPRFNKAVDLKTGYRTKTMLACPIVLDGVHCEAVVQAINKNDDGLFSEGDEVLLGLLGEQVGFQLRNQQLYSKARAALESERPQVLQVFRNMASDVSMDKMTMMKSLSSYACEALGCESAVVYCYDDETNLISYIEDGLDDEAVIVTSPLVEKTLLGMVKDSLVPITVRDASRISIFKQNVATSARNALAAPMTSATGELVGITVFSDKPRGFVHFDEVVARHFGFISAVAVENTLRLGKLLAVSSDTALPQVPIAPLGRITMKGGWVTIRAFIDRLRRHPKEKHRLLLEFSEKLMAISSHESFAQSVSLKSKNKTLSECLPSFFHKKKDATKEVPLSKFTFGAAWSDDEEASDPFGPPSHPHFDDHDIMQEIGIKRSSRIGFGTLRSGTFHGTAAPTAFPPLAEGQLDKRRSSSTRRKSIA
jgi:5'-nucleotidase